MTRNIWVISDTHFNHNNILNFMTDGKKVRDFSSLEEMNELIIENWNNNVKDGDIIYHLGDVFIGNKPLFETNWKRLKGKKRLIVGNHDDIKYMAAGNFFSKIMLWRRFDDMGLILSHIPLHEDSIKRHRHLSDESPELLLNVHGHIHTGISPSENHKNVCVEAIDYKPINIDELRTK